LRTFTRLITTFDEVRQFSRARTCTLQVLHLKPTCRLHENSVDLETSDRRSLYPATCIEVPLKEVSLEGLPLKVDLRSKPSQQAARRDSAVHVSLSSDSLVKQPGTMTIPLNRQAGEPSKLHASDEDRKLGSPNISEVLRRRDIAPKADGAPYGFI